MKQNIMIKNIFVDIAYNTFLVRVLECHVKNCLAIYYTESVLIPEENECINLQSVRRLTKAPFIIHFNFSVF